MINGQKKEIFAAQNLREIVDRFSSNPAALIAEVNGTIVKKAQWDAVSVNDGDTIELVSFVGGG
ncbi:MAG TPA: thiamine biosynthesis protein ThiS [Candidatus Omnitrophica bacterium]|nr:thiamine biosynthesis protein ThiS [Candidatus Omnitrophota bacterium]HCI44661.1 thiamine biosynthesis protein ThiS [Candidatus Omnitrophota bacterium]